MSITVIPQQAAQTGDIIEYGGEKYIAEQHFSQGKDMKSLNYTHIMYSIKGAFGMVKWQS
jgi:hypothetical protein